MVILFIPNIVSGELNLLVDKVWVKRDCSFRSWLSMLFNNHLYKR